MYGPAVHMVITHIHLHNIKALPFMISHMKILKNNFRNIAEIFSSFFFFCHWIVQKSVYPKTGIETNTKENKTNWKPIDP